MKVGGRVIYFVPGKPVGVAGMVGTFIKVSAPDYTGSWPTYVGVFFDDIDGKSVFNAPGGWLCDFRVDDFGEGVGNLDLLTIGQI